MELTTYNFLGINALTLYLALLGTENTLPPLISRTPCCRFYQAFSNTQKMGTESVPESLNNFQPLTRLSAREDFIEHNGTVVEAI